LERGYVYCVDPQSGDVVTRAAATRPRQRLYLNFADGMAPARIEGAGGAGLES
jgi:exonuclease VII large subunit